MSTQKPNEPSQWDRIQATTRSTLRSPSGLALVLLGTGTLIAGCLTLFVAALYLMGASGLFSARAEPTPTMPCIEPSLVTVGAVFRIQGQPLAEDGGLPDAPQDPAVAFWIEGSTPNYLMLVNPTPENQQALAALQAGMPVRVIWADCTRDEYVVFSVEERPDFSPAQLDQSRGGITIFLPLEASGRGLVVTSGIVIAPTETPLPGAPDAAAPEGLQADISFLETSPSADGKTLRLVIEVKNVGSSPLSLKPDDFSLAPDGAPDQPPLSTDPALPLEIAPGEMRQLTLDFPQPAGNATVFRVQDFTVEIYY